MAVRFYSNVAPPTTLTAGINNITTTITVVSAAGLPPFQPFTLALDPNTPTMELVEVTAAAGTTLTVTRAIDGTSASNHSAGAVVQHVSSARDFAESRAHENATAGVHGVAGAIVGTTDSQTLTNKTLTSPIVNTPTITGGTLTGTIAGTPDFTGQVDLQGGTVATGPAASTTLRVTGNAAQTADILVVERNSGVDAIRVAANGNVDMTTPELFVNGSLFFQGLSTATNVNVMNVTDSALNTLLSVDDDGDVVVGRNLTVNGIGNEVFALKTANTSRASTTTLTADPHLASLAIGAGAYVIEGQFFVDSNTGDADISLDITGSSTRTISWGASGAFITMSGVSSGPGEWRMQQHALNAPVALNFATATTGGTPTSVMFSGTILAGTADSISVRWAQRVSNATATTLMLGSWIRARRVS